MFQFCTFAPHPLLLQGRVPLAGWVAPFGDPRIDARLPAPLGLSQVTASFIASRRQDIHRVPLWLSHQPDAAACPPCFQGLLPDGLRLSPANDIGPPGLADRPTFRHSLLVVQHRPRDPLESHAAGLRPARSALAKRPRPPVPDGADVNTYPVVKEAAGVWDLPASRHPCRVWLG